MKARSFSKCNVVLLSGIKESPVTWSVPPSDCSLGGRGQDTFTYFTLH